MRHGSRVDRYPARAAHADASWADDRLSDVNLASAMALFGLFDFIGRLALNAFSVRASSEEESRERSHLSPGSQPPLDERLADFKTPPPEAPAKREERSE
jgi:hypothetical protein